MCFVKINFKNEKVLKSKIMPAILFEPGRSISSGLPGFADGPSKDLRMSPDSRDLPRNN